MGVGVEVGGERARVSEREEVSESALQIPIHTCLILMRGHRSHFSFYSSPAHENPLLYPIETTAREKLQSYGIQAEHTHSIHSVYIGDPKDF